MAMAIRPSLIERAMQRGASADYRVSVDEQASVRAQLRAERKARNIEQESQVKAPSASLTQHHVPTRFELNNRLLSRQGLLSPSQLNSPHGRQISSIKRNLLRRLDIFADHDAHNQAAAGGKHSVLVTSPNAHDGKSFMTINLALNLALEDGIEVLLIDADLRASHLAASLGLKDGPGLADLLAKPDLDPLSLIQEAHNCPLKIVPAGKLSVLEGMRPNVRDLARHVRGLIGHFQHSVVLVDAPPLLLTTESPILADAVDETLLVVNAGVSDSAIVDDAIDLLDDHDHLSIVLNRCRLTHHRQHGIRVIIRLHLRSGAGFEQWWQMGMLKHWAVCRRKPRG